MKLNNLFRTLGLLFVASLVAACASKPEGPTEAQVTDEVTDTATVLIANRETRELTLQRSDGTVVTIIAGPEIRNFDQIYVGDTIVARYLMSLSARRLAEGDPDVETKLGVAAARAEPGAMPAGAVGTDMIMTVVIQTVDYDKNIVTFTDPRGNLHAVEAERDEGKAFVAGLQPGDRVVLEYGQMLMLAVEE